MVKLGVKFQKRDKRIELRILLVQTDCNSRSVIDESWFVDLSLCTVKRKNFQLEDSLMTFPAMCKVAGRYDDHEHEGDKESDIWFIDYGDLFKVPLEF